MSTPNRQQVVDAWETMDWLKSLIKPESGTIQGDKNRLLHAIQDLADALPERPKQNMKELGWDNEYILAESDTFDGDVEKVVMLYVGNFYGTEIGTNAGIFDPKNLTPTGRRCKLVLDHDHPEYLETEQDYENAPEGTVAMDAASLATWMKNDEGWDTNFQANETNIDMSGERRRVLRWGWEW